MADGAQLLWRGRLGPARQADSLPKADILLRELALVPLLTAEEERSLALTWAQVRSQVKEASVPSGAYVSSSDPWIIRGLLAREKLILSNLRLVVSIAKRCLVPGMELEELVQEGTVGLIHAIDRFDPSLGYRLSTYATWWIRQMILRHLQTYSRLVRLPAHVTAKIHEVREATERLAQELSRIPSIRELAQTLEMKESKVSALIRSSQAPLYLNDHGPEEGRPSPGDTAAAPGDPDPYELAEAVALRQELYRALRKLPERERRVIVLRFGLPPADRSHNLEEIGKTLGVSAERARQLERQGLKRLRQIAGHSLRAYLMAD